MTTTIRARVKRWAAEPAPDAWTVVAWSRGTDEATGSPINGNHKFADAPSWPEAMQAAYKLLADLDLELMDEVHASRASRRAQRCTECHEVVPEGKGCTECDEVVPEVETKREMTSPMYVFRGGVYLLDEHAGVLIDSVGNFSAKTKGNPRSLAVLLKAIAEAIEDDVEAVPVEGEKP